jgi:hypothetical protein
VTGVQRPVLTRAVEKLAQAGEQAGITVEDMIRILNAGVSVERLLDLIEVRLLAGEGAARSSRWVV